MSSVPERPERPEPPPELLELARARAAARADGRFTEADSLRAAIEAAGWKPVDHGLRWSLEPLHPPDVTLGGRIVHGAAAHVPSRLDEPDACPATLVVVSLAEPPALVAALASAGARTPDGCQLVVVVRDAPTDPGAAEALDDACGGAESVWLSPGLGPGAALEAGLRRASGGVVVALAPGVEAISDVVGPVLRALDDPSVALAGAVGLRSTDLRRFEAAPVGDVDALDGSCLGFRRAERRSVGPIDEGYRGLRHLAIWWSLSLRDAGPGVGPRRAVALDLALRPPSAEPLAEPSERAERRDRYRLIAAFGRRGDLLLGR